MPYIVIKSDEEEIDRRELKSSIVIGRAAGCDVVIHEILLSRRHCQLDETPQGWTVTDLNSKNGTFVNGDKLLGSILLQDTDVVRLGRSKVVFYAGVLDEHDLAERLMTPARPVNPNDSLSGTLTGFTLLLRGEGESPENMPLPNPRPREPDSLHSQEVQELLTAIAASSWESIYAEARQPKKNRGKMVEDDAPRRRRARPRSPIDLSLQVSPMRSSESGADHSDSGDSIYGTLTSESLSNELATDRRESAWVATQAHPVPKQASVAQIPAAHVDPIEPALDYPGQSSGDSAMVKRPARWKRWLGFGRSRPGHWVTGLLIVGVVAACIQKSWRISHSPTFSGTFRATPANGLIGGIDRAKSARGTKTFVDSRAEDSDARHAGARSLASDGQSKPRSGILVDIDGINDLHLPISLPAMNDLSRLQFELAKSPAKSPSDSPTFWHAGETTAINLPVMSR